MTRGPCPARLTSPRWIVTLCLTGTAWSQSEVPLLKADTDLVRFAEPVLVGDTGQATVRVTNRGRAEVKIQAKLSAGADAFTVTPTESLVPSNGTQELALVFRPLAPGGREALLHVTNAADSMLLLTLPVAAVGRGAQPGPLQFDLLELTAQGSGKFRLVGHKGCVNTEGNGYQLTLVRDPEAAGEPIQISPDGAFQTLVDAQNATTLTLQLRAQDGAVLGSFALRDVPSGHLRKERIQIESVRGGTVTVRGEPGAVSTLTRFPKVWLRNSTRGLSMEVRTGENGAFSAQVTAAPGDVLAVLALGGGRALDVIENLGIAPPFLRLGADRWTVVGEPGASYSLYLAAGSLVRAGLAGRLDGKGRVEIARPAGVSDDEWKKMSPVVLVGSRDGRPARAAVIQ